MTIKTETRTVEITLRKFVGGWNAGWEPDCFDDLETTFRCIHTGRDEDGYTILATDSDVNDLVDCWKAECDDANAGRDGECLLALSEDEIARGDEWYLEVSDAD